MLDSSGTVGRRNFWLALSESSSKITYKERSAKLSAAYLLRYYYLRKSLIFSSILVSSVCRCVCLYLCLFALYRSQFVLKSHKNTPLDCSTATDDMLLFSEVKVKGQGQGHQKVKNHILVDNLRTDGLRRSRFFGK